ncbi:unnamed protein product [Gongylonema pulchrum]|uniref:DUF148 domain-containing protein n=1 Tax=Gongylonema pulchrum TaxID=637853 RepID=A0A183CVM7_9BILA|nr:unnamed protein product [Gongylonema pulchrum]
MVVKGIAILSLLAACAYTQQQNLPPFLQGAPQNVVTEFQQLLSGAGQRTDSQMEQEIESWANRQSAQIQASFQQFKQQMVGAIQQAEAQHQAAKAKLSAAALDADTKLTAIAKNPSLTGMQKQQQVQQIINSLPPNIKQELQTAMQG